MYNLQFGAFATFALLMGPWVFFRAFRDLRVRRLIENTPSTHIRSMAMGLVEITGEVVQRSEHQASQPPTTQKMAQPRKRKRELSTVWVLPAIELSQVSGGGTPNGLVG